MEFVNTTRNSVKLDDIGKVIPFLDNVPQYISTDEILKSKSFQYMCVANKFFIVTASDDRIEQNLLRMQKETQHPSSNQIKVSVTGQFLSNSGYGKANRNLVYGLAANGIDVAINIEDSDSSDSLHQSEIQRIIRFRQYRNDDIQIVSSVPSFAERPNCKYAILNTTIEAASVPHDFPVTCDQFDEIWVVSDFCKTVLEEYGVSKPIFVIPNSINVNIYNSKANPATFSPPLKKFVFVSVGTWGYRKGQEILLQSFAEEFSKSDDCTLLFVAPYGSNGRDDEISKEIEKYSSLANIARCGIPITEHNMPGIYTACNAFVLVSRGEGFGVPYLEAGACGLPVIATKHSGHLMFLNDDNSYLIDIDGLKEIPDKSTNIHYWDNHLFASIESERFKNDLKLTMRSLYEDRHKSLNKISNLSEETRKYSIKKVGAIALNRLEQICQNFTF